MYYPFLRGKQFELIALRELAGILESTNFTPVIEPVRSSSNQLGRAIEALSEAEINSRIIVNPQHGDFKVNPSLADTLDFSEISRLSNFVQPGILLSNAVSLKEAKALITEFEEESPILVHMGFLESHGLSTFLQETNWDSEHIFIDEHAGRIYRRHFSEGKRVRIIDGFQGMRNADYPAADHFSDNHLLYSEDDFDGFGDFLTIGAPYIEGGGPAYAVAIHLTYFDPHRDGSMFIHHFTSDTNSSPADPGRKFMEALGKLVQMWEAGESHLLETHAMSTLLDLHKRQHYPGLGFVKKLSIMHHIETITNFLDG